MEATPRGLFAGGDGNTKGGFNVGRVAFFDFNNVPANNATETVITDPIEGRDQAGPTRRSRSTAPRPRPAASTGSSSRSWTATRVATSPTT